MIEKGADINAKDCDGKTDLQCAERCKHAKIVQILQEATATDSPGANPGTIFKDFHSASNQGCYLQ